MLAHKMEHNHPIINDFLSLVALIISWLPEIQGVLGVLISLTVLLIQIKRYKNLHKKNKDNEKENK